MTGAAGFVGGWLGARLERDGAALLRNDLELDVCDAKGIEASLAAARPDAVVHLAARASVADSFGDAAGTARVNYLGSAVLLRAVSRRAPRARVLLVSSGEIYGDGPEPFGEDAPLRPDSPYARTKAAADLLAAAWRARGLDVVVARPFSHTGPGQGEVAAAPSFARQIAEIAAGARDPTMRVGNLDSVRDLLDVADVVEAYAALLDPRVPAGVYNVASGVGVPVRRFVEILAAHAGVEPVLEVDPERWRPTGRSVGDASRLRAATGWRPEHRLEETLGRLYEHWRGRLSAS